MPTEDNDYTIGAIINEDFSITTTAAMNIENFITLQNTTPGWLSEVFSEDNDSEPEVEYDFDFFREDDGHEYNEPFLYADRWYVVLGGERQHVGDPSFWSWRSGQNYVLRRPVRYSLFGSHNAFRITWDEDALTEDDGYSVETEDYENEVVPSFIMNTNIGREIPLVSFEQEFSGNGDIVSTRLHEAGIAYTRYPDSYHMSEARHSRNLDDRICYVETDSSCGYELIFDRIDLHNRESTDKITRAQQILRELKNDDHIRLSARCGFHVHVDVSTWGMKEIVSAYHLWNYLEDTIFRFSSAFWNLHREEEVRGGYSNPIPKGERGRVRIGSILQERRDALNFSHILRAKSECTCGAGYYEDWTNCTCRLQQPTLEFRVFNATVNQRKIKAYLAFCVAFVNLVKKIEHNPIEFREMRWRGTNVKEDDAIDGKLIEWDERTTERIKYILKAFPLTGSEKNDIAYCFENSSLEPVLKLL